jgi:hypothetical protein
MATDRTPVWFDAVSDTRLHPYGVADTLKWNFTDVGAGDPMVVQLSGADSFVLHRSGAMRTTAGYQTLVDGVGAVGLQYTFRPTTVNASTSVAAGAVFGAGAGSRLARNSLTLGHGNVNKYLYADQGLASAPGLRYDAVAARWQYSHDGVVWSTMVLGGLEVLTFHQTIVLSTVSDTTAIGLAPLGPVLLAKYIVASQVTGLDAADHHLKLGVAGTINKYGDVAEGAANAFISVNKKTHYAGAPVYEGLSMILTIDGGGDNIPSGGTVDVEVHYYVQDDLPDV